MTTGPQPLVSVFTPVHNGSAFLAECIESVLAQTYQNWRYVILDNASTDDTRRIAEGYARRDSRIRVEHNDKLLPIIANHNRAISLIHPEAKYCKPLWADDWMFPECMEKMVATAEAHPSIGLVCSLAFDGRRVMWDGLEYPATHVPGSKMGHTTLREHLYVFGMPSSTLLRADLVRCRPAFYNSDHWHADYEAC